MVQLQEKIIKILETLLGNYKQTKENEFAFKCPFCHHKKNKLEINIDTGIYHCWVCNTSGNIYKLFNKSTISLSFFELFDKIIVSKIDK